MSPIAARLASRVVQRRQVSMITSARKWAQSFEPHPYERIPVSSNSQKADYSKMLKRCSTDMVFYVPGIAILLGWPYLGAQLLQGHV